MPCNHFVNCKLNKEKIEFDKIIGFWNSEETMNFRKILNTYPSEVCSRYVKWQQCGGGCTLRWQNYNPNYIINEKYVYME